MPNLARANRRDQKHWKAAQRMPSNTEQQRVPRTVLAMLGARPKRHRRH
jgi:hypothetical protein